MGLLPRSPATIDNVVLGPSTLSDSLNYFKAILPHLAIWFCFKTVIILPSKLYCKFWFFLCFTLWHWNITLHNVYFRRLFSINISSFNIPVDFIFIKHDHKILYIMQYNISLLCLFTNYNSLLINWMSRKLLNQT